MTSQPTGTSGTPERVAAERELEDRRLREHGSSLRDDVRHLKEDAAAAASTARDRIETSAHQAAEMARQGQEQVQEYHSSFRYYVKRHPTTSVLGALTVGVLLGRFLAGK